MKAKQTLATLSTFIFVGFIGCLICTCKGETHMRPVQEPKTITFTTADSISITADLYLIADTAAPFILLCHQAGYSRGEYVDIAPKLNAMGFNCLAIDQRSGDSVNNVVNETHKMAASRHKATEYVDAIQDIEAAIAYIDMNYHPNKLILWGSSYSASIAFIAAVHFKNTLSAVIAFSPGEYFSYEGKTIATYAAEVTCPVFITSAKQEQAGWKAIYGAISNSEKQFFLPTTAGIHGAKALWPSNKGNEEYWKALQGFLEKCKK